MKKITLITLLVISSVLCFGQIDLRNQLVRQIANGDTIITRIYNGYDTYDGSNPIHINYYDSVSFVGSRGVGIGGYTLIYDSARITGRLRVNGSQFLGDAITDTTYLQGRLGINSTGYFSNLAIVGNNTAGATKNMFNFVDGGINKVRTTYTQATDTSSFNFIYTPTGKPIFNIVGELGNATTLRMQLDSVGNVGINTLVPNTWLNIRTGLTTAQGISVDGYSATTTDYPSFNFKRSHNNTLGTVTATTTGEVIGSLNFYGTTSGNAFTLYPMQIQCVQSGAAGANGVLSDIKFNGISSVAGTTILTRFIFTSQGRLGIGGSQTGSAPATPTYALSFAGNINQTIGLERHSTASSAGSNMSILAGGCAATANSSLNGGMLSLTPGTTRGAGYASVRIQRYDRATATSSSDNSTYDAVVIPSEFNLTDAGNNDLFEIGLADAGEIGAGVTIQFTIIALDATDIQTYTGKVVVALANDAGTLYENIVEHDAVSDMSTGTLTTAWSVVDGANKVTIRLVPTSSLTPTSFKCYYTVFNNSTQTITQL